MIIVIGDTSFLRSLDIPRVNNNGINPGINKSILSCRVVTFTGSNELAPYSLYVLRASLIPSAPAGKFSQCINSSLSWVILVIGNVKSTFTQRCTNAPMTNLISPY